MIKNVHILLVEDNEGDIVLTVETFKDLRLNNAYSVVRDGEQAIRFLRKEPPYENAITPDLILLDINLPKIDGKELLALLKKDEQLENIPVLMLTTSSAQKDIDEVIQLKANGYITKPLDFFKLMEGIQHLDKFYITLVHDPNS